MNPEDYLERMVEFQKNLLDYLDGESDFKEVCESINYFQNKFPISEIELILQLIVKIANNHYRTPDFLNKILQVLSQFKTFIQQNFSKSEIFDIFKSNKRILLYFIEESIIQVDQSMIDCISDNKYWDMSYIKYFLPEAKPFIQQQLFDEIEEEIKHKEIDLNEFKERRRVGENDGYICYLIRNDLIDEFVIYMNKTNTSYSKTITRSIFETNHFLMELRSTSLIEYSAFFGSIQIFKFLHLNNADLKPSIWLYAIHGKNPDIIHFLENNHIEPLYNNFDKCFEEAVKCHNNEIASYFLNNAIIEQNVKTDELYYKYDNYFFFDSDFNNTQQMYFFIKYNYHFLSLNVLKNNFNNNKIIHKIIFFDKVFIHFI